jgi:hypothetical protein
MRVDEVELEIESWCEERGELFREGGARGAEAEGCKDERDEQGEEGPECDGAGEEGTGAAEVELGRLLVDGMGWEGWCG